MIFSFLFRPNHKKAGAEVRHIEQTTEMRKIDLMTKIDKLIEKIDSVDEIKMIIKGRAAR